VGSSIASDTKERPQSLVRVLSTCGALILTDVTVRIAATFLPATWPLRALAIKRLRDSGRSTRLAVPLMASWLFAGGSLPAGAV
jgi:uncharacterized membrane protein YhaH (DUF805 family)